MGTVNNRNPIKRGADPSHPIQQQISPRFNKQQPQQQSSSQYEIVNEKFSKLIKLNKSIAIDDWQQIRNELLSMHGNRNINSITIDSIIMDLCLPNGNLEIGKSYIKYLTKLNLPINSAVIGKLLKLYYRWSIVNSENYTTEDEQDINKIYRDLLEKHELLDAVTCENLIFALSLTTTHWREILKLLDMIKITTNRPSTSVYNEVISALFKNMDTDMGWQLLNEMIKNNRSPKCDIFKTYFTYCCFGTSTGPKIGLSKGNKEGKQQQQRDKHHFKINVEKMLKCIGDNQLLVSKNVIDHLNELLSAYDGFNGNYVQINSTGKCTSCKFGLEPITIVDDEFQQLRSTFLQNVLIRKDVFLKSNPAELSEFTKFIDRSVPYDCIIDGLNVSYSVGGKKTIFTQSNTLLAVCKHFVEKKRQKILILGRKHMLGWSSMNYIKRNAQYFFTDNLSQDDPFLLYAALKSGPNTNILSRDLMRSHSFLLQPELKQIFRKWQQKHQYIIKHINVMDPNGSVSISDPITFNINAHKLKDKQQWHIPYILEYTLNPPNTYDIPTNWFCITFN